MAHENKGVHEGHSHGADARKHPSSRLLVALLLTSGFLFVEALVGLFSGSLALLSDAGHMLTDAGALAVALVAQRIAERERTRLHTFGFRRAEILAALLNGVVLGASAVWVVRVSAWGSAPRPAPDVNACKKGVPVGARE